MAIKNFNRIIDITLTQKTALGLAGVNAAGQQVNYIKCPRTGRKPEIEISGQILPADQVSLFEVKIKNLYDTKIVADLTQIQVAAGYEGDNSVSFTGTPVNVYTNSPGPDRETVIQCTTAAFGAWTSNIIKIDMDRGWTLKTAVQQITNALDFDEPAINAEAALQTAQVPWNYTGTANGALHELTRCFFPNYTAVVMNNRITVTAQNDAKFIQTFEVPFLSSAPQFSGNAVTLTAPWNPAIKPGDRVKFSTNYFTAENSLLFGNIKSHTEIVVNQIGFIFGTTGSANQMTIQGTLAGAAA